MARNNRGGFDDDGNYDSYGDNDHENDEDDGQYMSQEEDKEKEIEPTMAE